MCKTVNKAMGTGNHQRLSPACILQGFEIYDLSNDRTC